MHQVDLMVDARKQEWANERRSLVAKLDVREQEAVIQKATLSQKNSEVCLLTSMMMKDFCSFRPPGMVVPSCLDVFFFQFAALYLRAASTDCRETLIHDWKFMHLDNVGSKIRGLPPKQFWGQLLFYI